MRTTNLILSMVGVVVVLLAASVSCDSGSDRKTSTATADLSQADMENLVRRSYQYVALFNTLNNFAVNDKNPFAAGGWNKTHYPEGLMDASIRAIPRPNNDTLYVLSLLDLRK
ncbi:MAG: hypothetical protein V3S55_01640, partial [Nitrospiraceae bacterium]